MVFSSVIISVVATLRSLRPTLLGSFGHDLIQNSVRFHDPLFLQRRFPEQLAHLCLFKPIRGQ